MKLEIRIYCDTTARNHNHTLVKVDDKVWISTHFNDIKLD